LSENKFPTITEEDADTATRSIYEDIKTTMGVALVNLVWRHFAVSPCVLPWSWQVLKPHYVSGAVPSAARLLRDALEIPQFPPLNDSEWQRLKSGQNGFERSTRQATNDCDLREQAENVDAVLQTYEHGNAQNLVAMCYLQACIENSIDDTSTGLKLNTPQSSAEQIDQVPRKIPPLPQWSTLDAGTVETINAMTAVWVPAQYQVFSPSLFRHISYWPGFLHLYHNRLQHLQDSSPESLDRLSEQTTVHARKLARQMGPIATELPPLSDADQRWLQNALALFIDGMIARGVIIVPAMRKLLDNIEVAPGR
jgi:hypothetical protein